MSGGDVDQSESAAARALIKLATESWRFSRLFARLIQRLDAGEQQRYSNQLRFYASALEDSVAAAGLALVNLEGQPYDSGMAATALNASDFGPDDVLVVEQMLEPIIMGATGVLKSGTVILSKAPQ